jgi:PAS domain S-box-containing protein/diguanylate cyclase (GGDEF)-like protein
MVMKDKRPSVTHLAGQIAFIYALFSSCWILISDWLLVLVTNNSTRLTELQTVKGWIFVIVTSALLYALVRWGLRSVQASYSLLQAVIEGTTDAIFVKNLEGRYLTINAAGARIFGRAVEEIIGKNDTELFGYEIGRRIREQDKQLITSGKTQVYENVLPVEKQERTYLTTKDLYYDPQGNLAGLIGVAQDITERKQLLEQLRREKEDLSALSAVTANSISTLNLEELLNVLLLRIVKVMNADAAVILLKKDDRLEVRASIGIDEQARSDYTFKLGQGFAGTIATTMQPLYIEDAQTDSRVVSIRIKQSGIRTILAVPLQRHGELVGVLHVDWKSVHSTSDRELQVLEITAERCTMAILNAQLYERTKQLQERLQIQIDRMPIGCLLSDRELRAIDWNPAAEQIFGFTKQEVLGKDCGKLITPLPVRPRVKEIFQQLAAGKMTVHSINENMTKDGRLIVCEWHNTPLKEADGTVGGMLSMVQDITERFAAEEALRDSEQRYRTLFESHPHPMWVFDLETLAFLAVNDAAIHHYGYSREEFLAMTIQDIRPREDVPALLEHLSRDTCDLDACGVWRHLKKDGTLIDVEITSHRLVFAGRAAKLSSINDITQRRRAEQELRTKDEQYRTLARNFPNGAVFLFDRELRYILAEGSGIKTLGLESSSFEGKTIWEAVQPELCDVIEPLYRQALSGVTTAFEASCQGRVYLVQVLPVNNSCGEIDAGMAVTQDITERKQTEEQLRHYAYHEPLTGLPNRALFLERLEQRIKRAKDGEEGLFAVLLIELEHFEMVKYSLGHLAADQLMIATAGRLEACLQPTDTVAQVGSDEFAILLTNITNRHKVIDIAQRIHQLLMLPLELNGREMFSSTSIGIALSRNGALDSCPLDSSQDISNTSLSTNSSARCDQPEDFLRAADTAKHHARMQPQARHAVFNPTMRERAVARFQLEADLRRAIEYQQFQVYYQPIVSLQTGKVTGFEALVRWIHPTRGMVSPVEFIPLAEETGLISMIDWWVLREACRQLSIWQQDFGAETALTMSVNVSSVQLSQLGFLERLDHILRETGVKGQSLKLEITESGLLKNAPCGVLMLQQLKALGVQLSIDDFGTGYSSLARLHQLPIDTLKIDRSFVSQMGNTDSESLEIVRAIMTLAHTLDMDVIAEGVETQEHLVQLRSLECEYGQGYFFSRPVDSQAARKLLTAQA